ncbi:MAG: nuclear transport factor 2 family protein [Burkholderiales bacterium]
MTTSSSLGADQLIARVEAYFACVDRSDLAGVLAAMAPDCVVEYRSQGQVFEGREEGIRKYFTERNANCLKSWHGNFTHTVDAANNRIATRFDVRRTDRGAAERFGDNLNLFQFEGPLMKRIAVWRGEPTNRAL